MTGAAAPTVTGGQALARPSARLIVAFAVVTLALLLGGYVLYRSQELSQRNDAREAITAVSLLKIDQISRWRENQLSDAAVLQDSNLAEDIMRYLSAPTPAGKLVLRSGLLAWQQHKGYADVAVTDPRGNVVFSLSGTSGPLPRDEAAAIQQAFSLHGPVLTDLHREPGSSPHVSAVAPLFAAARNMQGTPHTPAGAVILYCDATIALYPLIISWPNAGRTAETVLVRRDGDAMLFLNDARYHPHSAFEVRVPLTRRDVPSVMAGDGKTGFVQGVDYLGVPVFADIRKIPGTTWFAITKIAMDEAMASWRAASVQIACLLAGLLVAVSTLFFALWQIRAKTQYKLLLEAGMTRLAATARLAALVDGSYDAITATTNDGVITGWNQAAEHLYGYSATEMVGQTIARLAPPGLNAEEDAILERIRRGEWIEPYDALRLTKDGRLLDVSLSVSPIKDASGRMVGSSRISRDITAQKRVRRDLDRLRWMLSPLTPADSPEQPAQTSVRHLAGRTTERVILDAAGDSLLSEIAAGFHALMGSCFAVHEANGDLAYSVLAPAWCRFLDASPMQHCASTGVCEIQACGKWLSHGSPGTDACVQAMAGGEPVDLESTGGPSPLRCSRPCRRRGGRRHRPGIRRPDQRPFPTGATGWAVRCGGRGTGTALRCLRNAPPLHRRVGQAAPGRFRPPAGRNRAAPAARKCSSAKPGTISPAPTANSNSSPTWPPMTCRSRSAWWPVTPNCWPIATTTNSTRMRRSSSLMPSMAPPA